MNALVSMLNLLLLAMVVLLAGAVIMDALAHPGQVRRRFRALAWSVRGSVSCPTDIGAHIKCVAGNVAENNSAGTRNGSAIDRESGQGLFESCTLHVTAGAASGSPTAQTLDVKIQDSADGSTGWADYTQPDGTSAAIAQQTADAVDVELDVNLTGAKRYLRVVEVIAFTGGSSPAWGAGESVVLGGSPFEPV